MINPLPETKYNINVPLNDISVINDATIVEELKFI